jgi:hypothetical protein
MTEQNRSEPTTEPVPDTPTQDQPETMRGARGHG